MSVRMVLGCAVSALVALMVVGGTAGTATSREPPGEPIPAEVDDYVSGYLERHGLPGAAVAVVEHGRTVHEAGYGADAHGRPLTEHARLRLASASKSITAFAVLRLVDDGAIALDGHRTGRHRVPVGRTAAGAAPGPRGRRGRG